MSEGWDGDNMGWGWDGDGMGSTGTIQVVLYYAKLDGRPGLKALHARRMVKFLNR